MGCLLTSLALAAQVKTSRTQLSANGKFGIRFRQLDKGQCQVEVLRESTPEFALDQCIGTIDDLYFVSNDGTRFWALYTLPSKPKSNREGQQKGWEHAVVAVLFNRQGRVIQSKRLSDVVPKRERRRIRQLQAHFQWVEGVSGVPGRRPRINSQNKVELEIIGGKTYMLSF